MANKRDCNIWECDQPITDLPLKPLEATSHAIQSQDNLSKQLPITITTLHYTGSEKVMLAHTEETKPNDQTASK